MATVKLPERPDTDALRARFLQDQKNKLNAANARVRAQFAPHHMNKVAAATPRPLGPAVPRSRRSSDGSTGAALYIKGKNFGMAGRTSQGPSPGHRALPLDTTTTSSRGCRTASPSSSRDHRNQRHGRVDPGQRHERPRQHAEARDVLAADVIVFNVDVALLSCSQMQRRTDATTPTGPSSAFTQRTPSSKRMPWAVTSGPSLFTTLDRLFEFLFSGWSVRRGRQHVPSRVGSTHYEWQVCWRVPGAALLGNFAGTGTSGHHWTPRSPVVAASRHAPGGFTSLSS